MHYVYLYGYKILSPSPPPRFQGRYQKNDVIWGRKYDTNRNRGKIRKLERKERGKIPCKNVTYLQKKKSA
jgi:hypothetical protein